MNKRLIRVLSLVLALVLTLLIVQGCILPLTAEAATADGVIDFNDFFKDAEALKYLTYVIEDEQVLITGCDDIVEGAIEIPATVGGYPVTAIGEAAFYYCDSLTAVTIPDGVTTIGNHAFANCFSLGSVTIPDSVTSMGKAVFDNCTSLDCTVYDNAKYLGNSNNPYLYLVKRTSADIKAVKIHGDTRFIGSSAFLDCTNLTSVSIPDGVIYIGNHAFANCSSLESVTIPDSVSCIDNWAFYYCTKLTSVTIPDSVSSIGDWAFLNCTGLTSVTIDNGVTSIGEAAFSSCTNLTGVTIPDSIVSIGFRAFNNCTGLTAVCYSGTERQWEAIDIGGENECLTDATIYYNFVPGSVMITKQPVSVQAANGKSLSVKFTATGDGLTYKWYFKDKGASTFSYTATFTGNSYDTVMTAARAGRQIYCVVTDQYGNSVRTNTVTIGMKASIATQPKSVQAANGKSLSAKFTATGDGLTYKWYYKDKGASTFSYTATFKGNSYDTVMTAARAGRQIYCVVTDQYGNSVRTNTVTIGMKVSISKQPASVTVASGKTASVSFAATGDGLSYKWYFKDRNGSTFAYTSTFKSNTYTTQMNTTRTGRQLYCVVTDQYGNTAKTNTVTINMTGAAKITKQPVSVQVANGKTVTVTLTATGSGLTYKWYYKDKGASSFKLTTTFKGNTYTTQMNSTRTGRQLYCVITDKYGVSVKTNVVTIGTKVSIATQPKSVTVANGKTAAVTVKATGDGLTYKWYYAEKGSSTFKLTTSFTGSTYSVQMNSARAGRRIYCVITDKYGNSVKTNTVTLNMA